MPDANNSEGSWLDTFKEFSSAASNAGQQLAGVYSTFLGAQTTANLANSQKTNGAYIPTTSELNAINAQRSTTVNIVTYVGIGLAALATLAIIYKTVKG